jgi:hypothetical protein
LGKTTASKRPRFGLFLLGAAALLITLALPAGAGAANLTFSNASPITIPAPATQNGAGSPYPSSIALGGLTGTVTKATVTLNGLTHPFPPEIDILLVGPLGQQAMLLSDACVGISGNFSNHVLTFDDDAAAPLPANGPCVAGTYKPTEYPDQLSNSSPEMPAPAPAGPPYPASLAALNGASPNGTWSLFAQDDVSNGSGSISGGWTLNLTVTDPPPAAVPVVAPAPAANPLCAELRAKLKKAKENGKKKKVRKLRARLRALGC